MGSLAGPELDVRLLVDHRERLVAQRTQLINDLRWQLHDLWPELEIPVRVLITNRWQDRIGGRLARAEQTARVRIARDDLRRIRELTRSIDALQHELAILVTELAPQTARRARLRRVDRRQADRRDRRHPTLRHRRQARTACRLSTDPGIVGAHSPPPPRPRGNRQLNCALHRLAVTKGRLDRDTAAYLARKQAEGKSRREALRCLKRHLARRVWRLLQLPADAGATPPSSPPARPRPAITIHCNTPSRLFALT